MENLSQITDKKQNASLLASTISNKSSSQQYSPKFQAIKMQKETKPVKFTSDNTKDYNQPFSLLELKQALQKSVLFNLKINNIVKSVLKGSEASLFVDDFALCISAKFLPLAQRLMQLCVNSVRDWVSNNGFKFSTSKTVCACTFVISVSTLQNRLSFWTEILLR